MGEIYCLAGVATVVKQVIVNKLRTAYEVQGKGPDILLVHGWMASKRYWYQARDWLPGFRVWAIDLYGFGDSEKPTKDYSLDDFAAFILGFLDAVRIERAAIVGHSMGGAVVSWAAMRQPERFWALGLVDAALTGYTRKLPPWSAYPLVRMFMGLADTSGTVGRFTISNFLGIRSSDGDLILEEARKADLRAATDCAEMISTPTDWSGMSELDLPALVVYGDRDFLLNNGVDDELKRLLPSSELHYIKNCGHIPMLEHPEEFYPILRNFMERAGLR